MHRETLLLIALQSGALFVALWGIFRLVPSIPANAKAWLWRLAFLKPLLSLLPFATITLPLLHEEPQQGLRIEDRGLRIEELSPSQSSILNPQPSPPPEPPLDPLLAAWLLGVAGVSLHALSGMRKALKVTKQAQPVQDPEIQQAYQDLLAKAKIAKKPALLQSENAASAMLVGGRRYAIVLPAKITNVEDVRLMLAHEVAHIVRRDLFWFGLASAAQSLFFFNPMVWVAARCSRLDHESATDLHASRLAGVPIQRYADMLLRATVVARPSYAAGALPVAESYRSIHRRLEAMKHFNSKPTLLRRTATAALAMLTLSLIPAYEVVAAGAPKMQEPPVVIQSAPTAPAKTTKKSDVTWIVRGKDGKATTNKLVEVKGKPGIYKVYELRKGKWVESKSGITVWRVETAKPTKGKGKVYRIVVPGQPAQKAKSAPKVVIGQAPAGMPPTIVAPAAAPSRPGAPGQPPLTIAAPAGQPGLPPSAPRITQAAPAGMPSQTTAPTPPQIAQPARTVTVNGETLVVKPGQSVTVSGQNVTIVNQGGTITVNGQAVTVQSPATLNRGTVTVPAQVSTLNGKYVTGTQLVTGGKLTTQGIYRGALAPLTVGGKLTTQGIYRGALAPLTVKGKLTTQGIYKGTTMTPTTVRGKDGKLYKFYTSGQTIRGKKKATKPEKPAPDNHHGATDPTYTGYTGV